MTKNVVFYDTAEQCADAAAPLFEQQQWNWSDVGVPDRQKILDTLLEMKREGYIATGRLFLHDGKFGHQASGDGRFASVPRNG